MLSRREFLLTSGLPFIPGSRLPFTKQGRRSCIFVNLTGGASQIDTWDPKPDAPSGVRGPFRAIGTNVPGMQIAETFPLMAQRAHLYTLVRSVYQTTPAQHGAVFSAGTHSSFAHAVDLIAQGERLVTIDTAGSWDAHGWGPFAPIAAYRDEVPFFDRDFSALLDGLSQRGLLASTLVIAMGEFGRTPRVNPSGGRDHWPHCRTALLAGGGMPGGEVWGSSDAHGAEPRDNPVDVRSLLALAG